MQQATEQATLFERLGGRDGITRVVTRVMANHLANPLVKTRFEHAQQTREQMIQHAIEFFCTGLSGVDTYEGRPLPKAHAGMNVTEQEFVAVLDDILAALAAEHVGELEQAEVLKILYGMKPEIVRL
jgi:hemoglobin